MATIEAMKTEKPEVAQAFLDMVKAVRANVAFDEKTGQLHVISILTALQAFDGVAFHTRVAVKEGATRDEVVSSIICCLATCGIGPTMKAMESAVNVLNELDVK